MPIDQSYFIGKMTDIKKIQGWRITPEKLALIWERARFYELEDFTRAYEWLMGQRSFDFHGFLAQMGGSRAERDERDGFKKEQSEYQRWLNIIRNNKDKPCDNDHQCGGCPANDPNFMTCPEVLGFNERSLSAILSGRKTLAEYETERMAKYGF